MMRWSATLMQKLLRVTQMKHPSMCWQIPLKAKASNQFFRHTCIGFLPQSLRIAENQTKHQMRLYDTKMMHSIRVHLGPAR